MSEAVEILIKADDQASSKIVNAGKAADKAMESNVKAFRAVGGQAKATTEFVGTLANLLGGSELAGFAGQIAGATEKVSAFAEVSKAGTAGAAAFKFGLMGLAATIGAGIGKALGDVIWQTAEFTKGMEQAKDEAARLDDRIKRLAANAFATQKMDIELIRDPEEKRAAYGKLLNDLNRDIAQASAQARKSAEDAKAWAAAWKITGDRTEYAAQAEEQAKADRDRLAALQEQRDEITKMVGVRAQEVEAIKAANAAKDQSEQYLETLRQEVEMLKATREEQIKIEAARSTTEEDRGEAERLLKERDAIIAKAEAEKAAEQQRKKIEEEKARAAEAEQKAAEQQRKRVEDIAKSERERMQIQRIALEQGEEAAKVQSLINQGVDEETAKEIAAEQQRMKIEQDKASAAESEQKEMEANRKRVADLAKAERERLQIQRIALEQGEEAAKVQSLINQGVDEETAKQLAADEAALKKLQKEQSDKDKVSDKSLDLPALQASESRLLTRGSGTRQIELMEQTLKVISDVAKASMKTADATVDSKEDLKDIKDNTSNVVLLVPTT